MRRMAGRWGGVVGGSGPGRGTHTDIQTCWEFLEDRDDKKLWRSGGSSVEEGLGVLDTHRRTRAEGETSRKTFALANVYDLRRLERLFRLRIRRANCDEERTGCLDFLGDAGR